MTKHTYDVIVIGAGHAGLSASYFLKQYGLKHVVFERNRIAESWLSQRWDSFRMNTPNKLNALPGDSFKTDDPDGFSSATDYSAALVGYARKFELPVIEHAKVASVEKPAGSLLFTITVEINGEINTWQSKQVIVASGGMNKKSVPGFADKISPSIQQLHSSEYRSPHQLNDGAVLVVGSAQSGCQVAEDLADGGRKVFLSTSRVARIPREYRGKDIVEWLIDIQFFNMRKQDIPDPGMLNMAPPQLTGIGSRRRTISLQSLAKKGVTLLGKLENIEGDNLFFQPNAKMHIQFADEFSAKAKSMIDEFIQQKKIPAPNPVIDEADIPGFNGIDVAETITFACEQHNIGAIIWATGLTGNFSYLRLPIFNKDGRPDVENGISAVGGLYFLGLPWLRNRKSTLLCGISEDAAFIAGEIKKYSTKEYQPVIL